MGVYLLRRFLLFIPNLILVSLLVFALGTLVPGSPVENRMPDRSDRIAEQRVAAFAYEKEYTRQAKLLGLDKPLFYFSIGTAGLPDTLYRIFPESRRQTLVELSRSVGSWQFASDFHEKIRQCIRSAIIPGADTLPDRLQLEKELRFMLEETAPDRIGARMTSLTSFPLHEKALAAERDELVRFWSTREKFAQRSRWYWPSVTWNGADNRYHRWLASVLRGDWGRSVKDGQEVFSPIVKAMRWTLLLNSVALLAVLVIAIPLGVYASANSGSAFDRWTHRIVYLFYSIPGFWLASLGIIFLTSDAYGSFWHWFKSAGITDYRPDLSFAENLRDIYPNLVMPVIILILPSLAFLFRQVRTAMLEEFDKSYALAARARGLTGTDLLWRTIFPNASFPIITMIGGAIPGLIAGSLIMEVIFAIPGMGRLMYEAMLSQDWNVLQGVIIIGTLLVMVSYLLTDILYAWMDPKVKLN